MATLSLDLALTPMLTPRLHGQDSIFLSVSDLQEPHCTDLGPNLNSHLPVPAEKNSWKDLRLNPDSLALQATDLATRPLTFLDYCLFH